MIQVYLPDNTDYTHNGDAVLIPTEATVSVELNGPWSLTLRHPVDTEGRWRMITDQAVIKAPSFNGEQLFRIIEKSKTDTEITATAEPIFMDARGDCFLSDIRPTNCTGQAALDAMTAPNAKYKGKSNIGAKATAYYVGKNLIEALCGEEENAFVNRWGGEVLYDNYTVIINDRAGGDYGVELLYGKNLVQGGTEETVDFSEVCTRLYPKAYNGYAMTDNGYVDSPLIETYPTIHAKTVTYEDIRMRADISDEGDEEVNTVCESQAELDAALRARCEADFAAGIDRPKVTITADMVLLENTAEYAEYKGLEAVSLGDTVHLRHRRLGITSEAKVIALTYDCLRGKVTAVTIGEAAANYFNDASSVLGRVEGAVRPDGSLIAERVSGFISGAMASLRAQYDVAKRQDVLAILFENLDPESELYGALGIGTQGVMIAKERTADGKAWDWTTALTANGLIADVIVTGLLTDQAGFNFWDLDTGEFHLSAAATVGDKTVPEIAQDAVNAFDEALDQQKVFDRLTNGGLADGIFLEDGQLYINASYIKTGTLILGGAGNQRGTLKILDRSDGEIGRWDNDGIYINGGAIYCQSSGGGVNIHDGQEWVTYKGTNLGLIGGNDTNGYPGTYGMQFDIESGCAFIGWGARSGSGYYSKLMYVNNSFAGLAADTLYVSCPLDMQNYPIRNASVSGALSGSFTGTAGITGGYVSNASLSGVSLSGITSINGYAPYTGAMTWLTGVTLDPETGLMSYSWGAATIQSGLITAVSS